MEIREADDDLDESEFPDEDRDSTRACESRPCPACGGQVHELSEHCPRCGHWIIAERRRKRSKLLIAIAFLTAIALLVYRLLR